MPIYEKREKLTLETRSHMHQVQTDFHCFLGKNKILCHDFSQSQLSVWPSFPSEKHVAEQYAFDLQGAP